MMERRESGTSHVGVRVASNEARLGIGKAKGLFLLAAGISFVASVSLFFTGDHERGIFVGIWVPSILSAGTLLLGREDHD